MDKLTDKKITMEWSGEKAALNLTKDFWTCTFFNLYFTLYAVQSGKNMSQWEREKTVTLLFSQENLRQNSIKPDLSRNICLQKQ